MNPALFKALGLLTGIALIFLSVAWSEDPDAYSYLLFVGGVLVVIGSTKIIVNEEKKS